MPKETPPLPIPYGFPVSEAAERDRNVLVAELRAHVAAWLPRAEAEWQACQAAVRRAAAAGLPAKRDNQAKFGAVLAYARGYRVQPDGTVLRPDGQPQAVYGRRPQWHIRPQPRRTPGQGVQRQVTVRASSLAGLCAFGAPYLARSARVGFLDGNPANLTRTNLFLTDRAGLRQRIAQRQRAARRAAGGYPRPEQPARPARGRGGRRSPRFTWAQVRDFRVLLDSGRFTRTEIVRRWTAAHPDGPVLNYALLAAIDLGRAYV